MGTNPPHPPRWERETVKDGEATKVRTSIPKTRIAIHATEADDRTDRRPWYHAAEGIDKVYPYEPWWGPRLPLPVRTTAHGRKRALSWAQHRPNGNPKPWRKGGATEHVWGISPTRFRHTPPPARDKTETFRLPLERLPQAMARETLSTCRRAQYCNGQYRTETPPETLSARQLDGRQDHHGRRAHTSRQREEHERRH